MKEVKYHGRRPHRGTPEPLVLVRRPTQTFSMRRLNQTLDHPVGSLHFHHLVAKCPELLLRPPTYR